MMPLDPPAPPPLPAEAESDQPLALLMYLDGRERVLTLSTLPPPLELRLPRMLRMSVSNDEPPQALTRDYIFRLKPSIRSPSYRWWFIEDGHTGRTSEHAFVYLEVRDGK